jgi:plastocyanin
MATAAAAAASTLAIASGNNQSGQTGDALASPLVVRVTDPFGNGVAGTPVSWAVTGGTATVNPASSSTGAAGTASTQVTLGMTAGTITIEATSGSLSGSPAAFTADATAPAPNTVQVINNQFVPATITVAVNTTVTWNWAPTALTHNITPDNPAGVPSQPTITSGPFTYMHTFTTPGTYDYYCIVHGAPQTGMHGTVIVQ